jgi:hypothetical protein
MSQILEQLHGAIAAMEPSATDWLSMVEQAIREREGAKRRMAITLDAHDAILHSNSVLRGLVDKQALEIHQLKDQIFREGEGGA